MGFRRSHFRHRQAPAFALAVLAWTMLVFSWLFGGIPGESAPAAKLGSTAGCAHMPAMAHASMSAEASLSAADTVPVAAEKHAQNAVKDDCCCAHGPIGLLAARAGAPPKVAASGQDWLALVPHPPQPQTRRLLRPPLA